MTKSTSQILQEARALVAQGWCQGPYSEEREGRECYCTVGALYKAADYEMYEDELPDVVQRLEEVLDGSASALAGKRFYGAVSYNEEIGRTQEEVLALFDAALVEVTK